MFILLDNPDQARDQLLSEHVIAVRFNSFQPIAFSISNRASIFFAAAYKFLVQALALCGLSAYLPPQPLSFDVLIHSSSSCLRSGSENVDVLSTPSEWKDQVLLFLYH